MAARAARDGVDRPARVSPSRSSSANPPARLSRILVCMGICKVQVHMLTDIGGNCYMKNKVGKGDTGVGKWEHSVWRYFCVKSAAVRITTSNMIKLLLMFVFVYLL
ncbi:hypothetical protein GUJ93_ZPchr0010g9173 [Zizania palustris]|uniref:Uncharacterized protein n=1 Tax=Zizania palustris TaxID=103762 RepID=A0A8J5W9U5_ZIZPA|nr:hypothetical protein GUJ93_ZPchr0010g9173 [Zizania palustris]